MRIIGNNPQLSRQTQGTASGAITGGKPVLVNTDGTVSVISTDTITQDVGNAAVFESAYAFDMDSVYDISNDKTIIFYQDNDNNGYLTAVVVTHASDGGLTYTTPVVAHSVQAYYVAASYDVAQAGKTVVYWRDQADPYPGKALVATLSGTSLSFGSAVTLNSTQTNYMVSSYDTNAEKHVVIYTDPAASRVSARVGTVSGTSISFGTEAVVRNHNNVYPSIVYDSNAQKHVCIWRDAGNSRGNSGYANVGTISGTDISFGSDTQFEAGAVNNGDYSLDIQFDSTNNKVIIFYYDEGNSNYGTAVVGTVSGTSISFGTPVVFEASNSPDYIRASFDTNVSKFLVAYRHASDGSKGKFRIATISGTSVSFTDATTFNNGGQTQPYSVVFDPDIKRHIIPYHDTSNSNYGTAISVRVAGETASNLTASTSESFIGFAEDTVATGQPVTINTKGAIVDNMPSLPFTITYDSKSFDHSSQDAIAEEIRFKPDGTKFYLLTNDNDIIYQYAMSTAWDISTASYESKNFNVQSQAGTPQGMAINADGTSFYIFDSSRVIYQYNLTTAYDISTASYASKSFSTTSQISSGAGWGIDFDNTGTKLYAIGSPGTVYQYTLSSAFDISTASYASKSFDTTSQTSDSTSLAITSDGTSLYVVSSSSDQVFKYTLSTAFDLATASYSGISLTTTSQDNFPYGVAVKTDETKLYVTGAQNDSVYQYSLSDSLTPAQTYFVQTDGTLSETADDPSVTAGTAVAGSTLIVKG